MRELKHCYVFYELPEAEREAMIGVPFREQGRGAVYVPIGIGTGFNYGVYQGLLCVQETWQHVHQGRCRKAFAVTAVSPDDYDLSLLFEGPAVTRRWDVIAFLTSRKWRGSYYEVLQRVQQFIGAGEFDD